MVKLWALLQTHLSDMKREEGQTLVEYGLIVALISIALVAVLGLVTGSLSTIFSDVSNALTSA
jgi:pilus assembly protein Flp/PilA